jgi:phosphomannomutase
MIPWLLVLEIMGTTGKPLSALVGERMRMFPASGEINRRVREAALVLGRIKEEYEKGSTLVDYTDGLSMEFSDWRFNLRSSNTEPVLRLNVESRGDVGLMREKTEELLGIIGSES